MSSFFGLAMKDAHGSVGDREDTLEESEEALVWSKRRLHNHCDSMDDPHR